MRRRAPQAAQWETWGQGGKSRPGGMGALAQGQPHRLALCACLVPAGRSKHRALFLIRHVLRRRPLSPPAHVRPHAALVRPACATPAAAGPRPRRACRPRRRRAAGHQPRARRGGATGPGRTNAHPHLHLIIFQRLQQPLHQQLEQQRHQQRRIHLRLQQQQHKQ